MSVTTVDVSSSSPSSPGSYSQSGPDSCTNQISHSCNTLGGYASGLSAMSPNIRYAPSHCCRSSSSSSGDRPSSLFGQSNAALSIRSNTIDSASCGHRLRGSLR
jgi:hypothetical protein